MITRRDLFRGFLGASAACTLAMPAWADESSDDARQSGDRALDWLGKNQLRDGGFIGNNSGSYPTSLTAMASMCFLMDGSTAASGKYSNSIRKSVDWFLKRVQRNGLIGNPADPTEAERYLYGHGFAMLFLGSCYGDVDDERKQKHLEKVLSNAVQFCGKAQTERGGWGYVSAADGGGFDEGSVTVTQLQGLRAAHNASIDVPKTIIDKANKYLRDCTTPSGGIIYGLSDDNPTTGVPQPALTAAAVACAFSAKKYKDDYTKKWLKYCKENIRFGTGKQPHEDYLNYYFSQCAYVLGEDGYAKLFPNDKNPLRWSTFRKTLFSSILPKQKADGRWEHESLGPVYATAVNATILQLEKNLLPMYER